MTALKIRDIRTILTMPDGVNRLVIVKVETSEPGLYPCSDKPDTRLPVRLPDGTVAYP